MLFQGANLVLKTGLETSPANSPNIIPWALFGYTWCLASSPQQAQHPSMAGGILKRRHTNRLEKQCPLTLPPLPQICTANMGISCLQDRIANTACKQHLVAPCALEKHHQYIHSSFSTLVFAMDFLPFQAKMVKSAKDAKSSNSQPGFANLQSELK